MIGLITSYVLLEPLAVESVHYPRRRATQGRIRPVSERAKRRAFAKNFLVAAARYERTCLAPLRA